MTPISTHIPGKYRCLEAGAVLSQGSKHVLIIRGAENHNKTSGNGGKWIVETEAGSMSCAEAIRDWQITPAHEAARGISAEDQAQVDGLRKGLENEGDDNLAKWSASDNPSVQEIARKALAARDRPRCSRCRKDLIGEPHTKFSDGTRVCHACA